MKRIKQNNAMAVKLGIKGLKCNAKIHAQNMILTVILS